MQRTVPSVFAGLILMMQSRALCRNKQGHVRDAAAGSRGLEQQFQAPTHKTLNCQQTATIITYLVTSLQ